MSDEQVVRAYQFTDDLRGITLRLLNTIATSTGASAIIGERGTGKSHLTTLLRSISNLPHLSAIIEDPQSNEQITKFVREKFPPTGIPTLTIGFDPEKGLNFIKAFPKAPGLDGELASWVTTEQIDELIEKRINSSNGFALFIDGISPFLRQPQTGPGFLKWLEELSTEAAAGRYCLIVSLDQELISGEDNVAEELKSLFSLENISITNLVSLIDQGIFRKTPQQKKSIEILYGELRARMPHFTGSLSKFNQLYPVHPVVVDLSPAMRRYARTFSLFGFITAVSARAMVRRGLNLICLDDLFESFEFDLRKNPNLTETFATYDHLFSSVIPELPQPRSLYAKMMLKGLLLLSLAGRACTSTELADAVMLYDDQEQKLFREVLSSIMSRLAAASTGITVVTGGVEPRYKFNIQTSAPLAQPVQTVQRPPAAIPVESHPPVQAKPAEPPAVKAEVDPVSKEATAIPDDELQLDQLLLSTGKKYFKDWPLVYEATGTLRERVEINLKWRGSLRKGIFKFGGKTELYANTLVDDQICEYDWQVNVFRAYEPALLPPPPDAPPTLLFWYPDALNEQELLVLKSFYVARHKGAELFDEEESKRLTIALENRVSEIFSRVYIQEGHLVDKNGKEMSLNQASSFLNTLLTKLLDLPLAERYPDHPKFEDLLDPEYIEEMVNWMFASDKSPTPDQQTYLEQFARPLQLIRLEKGKYKLETKDREFPIDSIIGQLIKTVESSQTPISKLAAYKMVRGEPFGMQRPALLLILGALAAAKRICLVDEFGEPIHNEDGLRDGFDLADFSAICSINKEAQQPVSWKAAETPQSAPQTGFHDYTVMIVDDDPSILMVLELATSPLNCRLISASDGIDAIRKLQENSVDLVISDLRMPKMTGIELFHHMQANPLLRDIPFVVLTSVDSDDEVAAALETGIEDYWLKPFRVQEITARIKRLLRRCMTSTSSYAIAAWPNDANEAVQNENGGFHQDSDVSRVTYTTAVTTVSVGSQTGEHPMPREYEDIESVKIDTVRPGSNHTILPAPAVSRLNTENRIAMEKSSNAPGGDDLITSLPLPTIPHPPIPHPPVPQEKAEELVVNAPSVEVKKPGAQPPAPPLPVPTQNRAIMDRIDELAIPSVSSEFPAITEPAAMPQFEITDDEEERAKKEQKQQSDETSVVFCIKISDPEAMAIDIMQLYNQFWDTCRRVGNSVSTPEYEEFKNLIISKTKKLKKQFNCDELIFTVEIESDSAHVDCQINRHSDYLKNPPKFRLF